MTTVEMPNKYQPHEVEAGRYDKWLKQGVFEPNGDKGVEPYSIVIPPPNVTGKLHLGHAWDVTLQDMLIRQKRMQGYDTLWLPGMDLSLIHISEPTRRRGISYAVFCLKKKKFHP